jgi:hypothetical protein
MAGLDNDGPDGDLEGRPRNRVDSAAPQHSQLRGRGWERIPSDGWAATQCQFVLLQPRCDANLQHLGQTFATPTYL